MSRDVDLAVHADDTQARRALFGLRRALAAALARDRWNRTHCTITLVQTGRGVADNPVCAGRPVTGIRWAKAARADIDAKRVIGFEPAYQFDQPQPDGGITPDHLREAEAALAASAYTPIPSAEVTSPLRRRG